MGIRRLYREKGEYLRVVGPFEDLRHVQWEKRVYGDGDGGDGDGNGDDGNDGNGGDDGNGSDGSDVETPLVKKEPLDDPDD